MTAESEKAAVKAALQAIPGLRQVYTQWPDQFSATPCLVLQLAAEQAVDIRDGQTYVSQLEWYVRLFTTKEADTDAICPAIGRAMEEQGYQQTFRTCAGGKPQQETFRFRKAG